MEQLDETQLGELDEQVEQVNEAVDELDSIR